MVVLGATCPRRTGIPADLGLGKESQQTGTEVHQHRHNLKDHLTVYLTASVKAKSKVQQVYIKYRNQTRTERVGIYRAHWYSKSALGVLLTITNGKLYHNQTKLKNKQRRLHGVGTRVGRRRATDGSVLDDADACASRRSHAIPLRRTILLLLTQLIASHKSLPGSKHANVASQCLLP